MEFFGRKQVIQPGKQITISGLGDLPLKKFKMPYLPGD
jgi:hypothetical protein